MLRQAAQILGLSTSKKLQLRSVAILARTESSKVLTSPQRQEFQNLKKIQKALRNHFIYLPQK
jgi:hypothetical protein